MKKILFFAIAVVLMSSQLYADGNTVFKSANKKVEQGLKKGIAYNMSIADRTGKNSQKGIVYNKGNKARMEFANLTTIIDGDDMYLYNVNEKSAMKMSTQKETGKNLESFDSSKLPDNAVFVKSVTKNGYNCQLVTSEEDGVKMEYYLTDEFGFPTYVKTSDGNEINMTNFKLGVNDDKFKLPSNVKVTDLSGYMGSQDGSKKDSALSSMMKDLANETVVEGAKDGKDEVVSEQKSKAKEETKTKTKESIKKLFSF